MGYEISDNWSFSGSTVWVDLFLFYFRGNKEKLRRHKAMFVFTRYPEAKERG